MAEVEYRSKDKFLHLLTGRTLVFHSFEESSQSQRLSEVSSNNLFNYSISRFAEIRYMV